MTLYPPIGFCAASAKPGLKSGIGPVPNTPPTCSSGVKRPRNILWRPPSWTNRRPLNACSAASRPPSARSALEALVRLRKVGQALSPGNPAEVGQAILSPAKNATQPPPEPPSSPSKQTAIPEIGSVPEILPEASPDSPPTPEPSGKPDLIQNRDTTHPPLQ